MGVVGVVRGGGEGAGGGGGGGGGGDGGGGTVGSMGLVGSVTMVVPSQYWWSSCKSWLLLASFSSLETITT